MASYLPGVSDYIPQTQPFKPDFNFYSNALSFRQAKYDAGYEQLNTLYSSMLNGPMTRADNKDDREKFFKTIKNDIQKMAGTDLSKEQNVTAAGNVFDQLLDNDYIAKDMAWTKNMQTQQRRGQALKNCVDPKECGGEWWEGGDTQLQYKAFEFQNMSRDQSLQARNVEYTAFQNVQEKAIELAEKMDLNVSAVTKDDGKWVITQTNGSLIEGDLYNMFVSTLGQDPSIKKYNSAKAYNQRMNYSTSKMQELGSLDAANNDYFLKMQEQIISKAKEKDATFTEKARASRFLLDSKLKVAESEPENYSPGLKGLIEQLAEANELDTRNRDVHRVQSKTADAMKNVPNLSAKLNMLDDLIGTSLFENDMKIAAHTLSKRNASIERKENPYGLATFRSDLRRKEAIEKAKLDALTENKKQGADQSGYNTQVAGNISNGDPSKQNNRGNSFKIARDMHNTVEGKVKEIESKSIRNYYKVIDTAARNGDVEAQNQLVELGNIYMKNLSGKQNSGVQGKHQKGDKDLAYWLMNSLNLDSDELDPKFLNEAYNGVVKPSVDTHKANESSMVYLKEFAKSNEKVQASIDANLLMADEIQREVKSTVEKVRAEVMAGDDVNHEAFDMLYDEFGAKRNREDFKERYITEERVNELMKGSSIPFGKGYGGLLYDEIGGIFSGANDNEIKKEYIKTLSDQIDEFYDDASGAENLKFFEDNNKDDFDQFDMQDLDDEFERLFRKHDKSQVANKYFDVGDDAFIASMITGNIDSAYPQTDANRKVSEFVQESGASNSTEYFIPNLNDGMLERNEDAEYRGIAASLAKSMFADIQGNASKATSDSRAKYRFEYSPMLDGNEGVQYLRVFPSPQYLQKMTSTSGTKILNDKQLQAITANGIIISYPTSGSNTGFYKKSKQTAEEYIMERKSTLPIDINHQYYQNMNITENAKGFSVNGQYLAGLNSDGSKAYRNYSQTYSKDVRLNALLDYYNNERLETLQEMYQKNVLAFDKYKNSI